ncbi:hypothetical protein [Anthocerotibacter panamensis]|uniref:hypothetical protein n=1 Tax=Anthocerotibacter panamensis TaxID=2857077 RepID=UPI001C407D4D|nr:hypothetical protein [Anthocerotibacter panamensis]
MRTAIVNGTTYLELNFRKSKEPSIATALAVDLFLQQKFIIKVTPNKNQKNLIDLVEQMYDYIGILILQDQIKCYDTSRAPFNSKFFQEQEYKAIEFSRILNLCRKCFEWAEKLAGTERDNDILAQLRTHHDPYILWVKIMLSLKKESLNGIFGTPLFKREKKSESWKNKLDAYDISSVVGRRRHFIASVTGKIYEREKDF